jgi:hypothetical protein
MSNEIIHNGVTAPIKVGDTIGLFPVTGMSEAWDSTEEGAEAVTITHADEKYAYFSSETTGDTGKFAWTLRSACLNSGYPKLYYKPDNFHNCYELISRKN